MIKQYSHPIQTEYQQPEDNRMKWIFILIGIVILGIILTYFLFLRPKKLQLYACGNNICETMENCYDCSADCKCQANQYCSDKTKNCLTPTCGNGKCEPFENTENCCDDCPCLLEGETCNPVTHACEPPEVGINDERAKDLIESYLSNQGKIVEAFIEIRSTLYENQPAKLCTVQVEGEDNLYSFIVTETEEMIEVPIF